MTIAVMGFTKRLSEMGAASIIGPMFLWIVLGVVALVLLVGWRMDRKDKASAGRSRSASDMTREAMRSRQRYRGGRAR
jgi:hypothetical protein